MMKHYLRFGDIPLNGRSINFHELSIDRNENFGWMLKNIRPQVAYAEIPETALEAGVSCFNMGRDRMPVINNMALIRSLASRIGEPIFEIIGEEVGRGVDGEPLVKVEKIIKTRRIKPERLAGIVVNVLKTAFKTAVKKGEPSAAPHTYYLYSNMSHYCKDGFADFYGWSFENPIDTFDFSLRHFKPITATRAIECPKSQDAAIIERATTGLAQLKALGGRPLFYVGTKYAALKSGSIFRDVNSFKIYNTIRQALKDFHGRAVPAAHGDIVSSVEIFFIQFGDLQADFQKLDIYSRPLAVKGVVAKNEEE